MYPLGTWFVCGTYEGIPYIKEIKIKIIITIIYCIILYYKPTNSHSDDGCRSDRNMSVDNV